ncbi:protein wntless [Bacillus rossius redtenbacheri]|uniref:protein wntless n=1 Tax=Bacillus rossius redtenbacheri TaxID=93214 RepID=UPI002FDD8035
MTGAVLENLSGKKLAILIGILLLCQVICFLIGGLIAPTPTSAESMLATKCFDSGNNTNKWFYSRGRGNCREIDLNKNNISDDYTLANQLVFVFQLPVPREMTILDYSRWQQNLMGVLQFDIEYQTDMEMANRVTITLDSRLGYRNKGDPDDAWKMYAASVERRILDCTIDDKRDKYLYKCSIIPLFELGSLHHDFYLLNVRLPVDDEKRLNEGLGHVADLWLVAINQNGGFTKVWVSLKAFFFPFILIVLIWFWNRVHQLSRRPALLEYMLLYLGCALTVLNMPLEFLTLAFDMPFMLLLDDIRQGLFYAALLSFWLVFAGEHLMIQDSSHETLRVYWKHLSAVAIGCLSLFVFDMCERGIQLRNPFYSIWVSDVGTNLALTFIILAGISAGVYFVFLCYMIWKVFRNISTKRTALPSMSTARRLHYEGIIYRFKFLMLATLLCAALTVIGFILGQASEGRWKWGDDMELEFTSAFFTGVYGMWNIYIFAMIVLYAPSHKQWPVEADSRGIVSEEIEFSRLATDPSEISSLTTFARKSALD